MKKIVAGSVIGWAFLFFLCTPIINAAEKNERFYLGGCKTEYFLIKELADAFEKEQGIKPGLFSIGNKKAVQWMMNGRLDCAFTCKHINKIAKKLKIDKNKISGWVSVPIAKDPILIVSNSENGINQISNTEITDIFKGTITNWKDVGGNDMPINLAYIDPIIESGMFLLFKEFTVGAKGKLHEGGRKVGSPVGLGNYVSVIPGVITFLPFNAYKKTNAQVLKVDGIKPDKENILDGSYKMSATYHLTFQKGKSQRVAQFVNFCLSEQGKKIISNNFVPFSNN